VRLAVTRGDPATVSQNADASEDVSADSTAPMSSLPLDAIPDDARCHNLLQLSATSLRSAWCKVAVFRTRSSAGDDDLYRAVLPFLASSRWPCSFVSKAAEEEWLCEDSLVGGFWSLR
jgi:hypothetical protein